MVFSDIGDGLWRFATQARWRVETVIESDLLVLGFSRISTQMPFVGESMTYSQFEQHASLQIGN